MPRAHVFSYPRSSRLRKHEAYQSCYAEGRKYHTSHFMVFVKRDAATDGALKRHLKTGVSVSKKVGCAVVRNRLKRILREFFRLRCADADVCADIVVVVKKQAGRVLDLRLTEAELGPLFERILHTHERTQCLKDSGHNETAMDRPLPSDSGSSDSVL